MKINVLLCGIVAAGAWIAGAADSLPALDPAPSEVKVADGAFARAGRNVVGFDAEVKGAGAAAALFCNTFGGRAAPRTGGCAVKFVAAKEKLAPRGYQLVITPKEVTVAASDTAGFAAAVKTLQQLSAGEGAIAGKKPTAFPCVTIRDVPKAAAQ